MPVAQDNYARWTGQLSGNMKTVYDKGEVSNLFSVDTPLLKLIGGLSKNKGIKKVGDHFEYPLGLTYSQGHSYHARGSGAFPFRKARPGKVRKAEVDAQQHFHRTATDWESMERAADGNGNIPEGAYEDTAKRILRDLRYGTMARVEESFWYGSTHLCVFVQGSAVSESRTIDGVSTAGVTLTITYESFAIGLFVGKEGAPYDLYELDANGRPTGTRKNVAATESLGDGTTSYRPMILEQIVSMSDRKIFLSGHATDISAIVTAVNTVDSKRYGLTYWDAVGNETKSIDWIATNAALETYSGLDPSLSLYLQAHLADNENKQMSYTRFIRHLNPLVQLGLSSTSQQVMKLDGKEELATIDVWCNPSTHDDLTNNETGQVRHNTPTNGQATQGFDTITMITKVGRTRFFSYPRIRAGEMFVMPSAMICEMVGTSEPYLKDWGNGQNQYLRQIEGVAGVEAAMYGVIGLFVRRPAWLLKIKNIRNSDYSA